MRRGCPPRGLEWDPPKTLGFTMFPACDEDEDSDDEEANWRLHHEHPVCHHQDITGDFRAYRLFDFVTKREWRRRELYADHYGPAGLEYQMCVGLDAPLSHTKVFVFNRHGGHDFSERDRAVANLLRPHLTTSTMPPRPCGACGRRSHSMNRRKRQLCSWMQTIASPSRVQRLATC